MGIWFCGCLFGYLKITTIATATTTATATTERLFEDPRVVLRFCKGKEELRGAAVYWAFLLWIEVLVQWC